MWKLLKEKSYTFYLLLIYIISHFIQFQKRLLSFLSQIYINKYDAKKTRIKEISQKDSIFYRYSGKVLISHKVRENQVQV